MKGTGIPRTMINRDISSDGYNNKNTPLGSGSSGAGGVDVPPSTAPETCRTAPMMSHIANHSGLGALGDVGVTASSSSAKATTTTAGSTIVGGRGEGSRRTSASKASAKEVHPLVGTSFAPTCHELSTWAYLTVPRPSSANSGSGGNGNDNDGGASSSTPVLPNLVTAHGNTLRIYVVDPISNTLLVAATYEKLAGIIVSLHCIPCASGRKVQKQCSNIGDESATSTSVSWIQKEEYDGLLLGFAGHPRLSMVYPSLPNISNNAETSIDTDTDIVWNGILTASSIIDLTPLLLDHSWGSVSPFEQDLMCDVLVTQTNHSTSSFSRDSGSIYSRHQSYQSSIIVQDTPTVGVILGGGVAVALFQLPRSNYSTTTAVDNSSGTSSNSSWWWRIASEPYCLPLTSLAQSIPTSFNPHAKSSLLGIAMSSTKNGNDSYNNYKSKYSTSGINPQSIGGGGGLGSTGTSASFCHGFGDIISLTFLHGYTEPVVVLLHSDPNRNGGRVWSGRLSHTTSYNTRYTLTLTAISVSTNQQRSVILWSLKDVMPSDAWKVVSNPISRNGSDGGGVIVLGVNEVLYVDRSGKIRCCLAVNGWVRSTGSSALLQSRKQTMAAGGVSPLGGGIMQPNPSPLSKLSIQLDGCCLSFVSDHTALLSLRDGTLYSMELHYLDSNGVGIVRGDGDSTISTLSGSRITNNTKMCISLAPIGFKLGALGAISSLCAFPLLKILPSSGIKKDVTGRPSPYSTFERVLHAMDEGETGSIKMEDSMLKKDADSPSSLGLVFAGSRMGDSTLLLYGMKEDVRLIPLDQTKESNSYSHSKKPPIKMDTGDALAAFTESEERGVKRKRTSTELTEESTDLLAVTDDEMQSLTEEEILQREEEELYSPVIHHSDATVRNDNILPLHDESEDQSISVGRQNIKTLIPGLSLKQLYRPQIQSLCIFKGMTAIDSLTGLGPIGPGCVGPTASTLPSEESIGGTHLFTGDGINMPVGASSIKVHPCGYGNSGGLAVYLTPGLNYGSTIMNEVDCRNIAGVFWCTRLGYVFLTKEEENLGCLLLQFEETNNDPTPRSEDRDRTLIEVDIDDWHDVEDDARQYDEKVNLRSIKDILTKTKILTVKEFTTDMNGSSKNFILILLSYENSYIVNVIAQSTGKALAVVHSHKIRSHDTDISQRNVLISTTISESLDQSRQSPQEHIISVACVWSSGCGSILNITTKQNVWVVHEVMLGGDLKDREESIDLHEDDKLYLFYNSNRIVAMDLFEVAEDIFQPQQKVATQSSDQTVAVKHSNYDFDEDDLELYGDDEVYGVSMPDLRSSKVEKVLPNISNTAVMTPTRYNTLGGYISGANLSDRSKLVLAICRQSGELQMVDVLSLFVDEDGDTIVSAADLINNPALWQTLYGCGQGVSTIQSYSENHKHPRYHNVLSLEIKFFFTGPSNSNSSADNASKQDLSILRSLCLLIETSQGDLQLYSGSKSFPSNQVSFQRVSIGTVTRSSQEEARHRNKLIRKGITTDVTGQANESYRGQRLHRFFSVSNQDGLFAATSRPIWIVSERGVPTTLCHRLRHCAPAGGRPMPLAGFSSEINPKGTGAAFLTLHERIGRVGSQRLTLFSGLSEVFSPYGLLPGGGACIQKVPLGVTVRKVLFIDDPSISSTGHPIYALLVSREVESDQSHLNDDGLTPEERTAKKEEKEKEQLRKQVEADLGGFDIEQEWVEEIEREDCFEIDKRFGGAPSAPHRVYEIWLIDASEWNICDTYQFGEYEHAIDMKVMTLSELDTQETSGAEKNDDIPDESLFLVVGVGNVDNDGEDVSSKGRVSLFELKGSNITDGKAEINFVYGKDMSLGPVTSLACLSCENRNRLVVGAGAEITLEQWGNGKLTQVGFFHARMYVQEIILFKTFMLISDAYDSLNLLVWRESDKSLTLLAKDYEPTSVYAAGLLSRGGSVSFACHDDRQNLLFFSYAPNDAAARGGNKLVCKADFHLGTQTVGLQSHFCRSSLLINSATIQSSLVALKQQDSFHGRLDDDQRFALHFGTTDGGLGYITPLSDNVYWRLAALTSVMSNALESDCALSGRSWRLYRRTTRRGGCKNNDRKKGVIDGDLALKYVDLPLHEQENLASSIGSTVGLILDNLLEISCSSYII